MKVLIVEDVALLCQSLVRVFRQHPSFETVHAAYNGRQAVELYHEQHPDYMLLDIEIPYLSGLRVAEEILRHTREVVVVLMSIYVDQVTLRGAFDLPGISGFLCKADLNLDELPGMLLSARPRQPVFSPTVQAEAKHLLRSPDQRRTHLRAPERRLLSLVGAGYTDEEIAVQMATSVTAVTGQIQRLREKLGLHTRCDMVLTAMRHGSFRPSWT